MQHLQDHPQHLMPPSPEQVLFFGEFRPKEGGEVDEVCFLRHNSSSRRGEDRRDETANARVRWHCFGKISLRQQARCVVEVVAFSVVVRTAAVLACCERRAVGPWQPHFLP